MNREKNVCIQCIVIYSLLFNFLTIFQCDYEGIVVKPDEPFGERNLPVMGTFVQYRGCLILFPDHPNRVDKQ